MKTVRFDDLQSQDVVRVYWITGSPVDGTVLSRQGPFARIQTVSGVVTVTRDVVVRIALVTRPEG